MIFSRFTSNKIPQKGRFYWVTTSIARFDPENEWPTDLEFSIRVKQDLVSFDGVSISLVNEDTKHFRTESLTMSIIRVISETAQQVTDGEMNNPIFYFFFLFIIHNKTVFPPFFLTKMFQETILMYL